MKRRQFGSDFFDDDFFKEFEKIEEMMREMMEGHLNAFDQNPFGESEAKELKGARPRVYGFTLEFGPEGKGKLTEFGNQQTARGGRSGGVQRQKERGEPFVDVIDHPDSIRVIAELPGVLPKDLQLKAFPKQLSIRVTDPDRLLSKTMMLPAEVIAGSLESSLKNGILEVVLKKKK